MYIPIRLILLLLTKITTLGKTKRKRSMKKKDGDLKARPHLSRSG
jgi:hypothetical protein